MKMKRYVLAMLFVAAMPSLLWAQDAENDSVVNVIAWFCKGDTLTYQQNTLKAEVVGTDTTIIDGMWREFQVCVKDSTKKSFLMEYTPLDISLIDSTSEMGRIKLAAARAGLGWHILFTTDELGAFKEITNWREVYDRTITYGDQLVNKLYKDNPTLYSMVSKADVIKQWRKQFDATHGTKAKMTESLSNLYLLFAYHGKWFTVGESDVESKDGKVHYIVSKGKLDDEEYSTDDDYQLAIIVEFPEENSVNTTVYYDYNYFVDGWPSRYMITTVEKHADRQVITQERVEWEYRAWR